MQEDNKTRIGLKIRQTEIAIDKYIDRNIRSKGIGGMTGMEGFTLVTILKHGPLTATSLRKVTRLSKASTSATLAGLEKKGLIVQVPNGEDKRSKILEVTEKGREADKIYHAHFEEMDQKLSKGMSQEDVETLLTLLERVRENIEEAE